jgi:hypothetical protein
MTNKPLPILDENRPAQSAGSDMLNWIRSLSVQLPKLSPMALQSSSFDFYDASLKNGEPTAAKIAAGIMNLPDLEQRDAAARRSEWSRSRCVEWLRSEAARLNVELVQIAEKTKSEAVKVAVIDAIYGAIVASYPHLKNEAADMSARQKLKLTKASKNGAAVSQAPEPVAPNVVSEAPKATLAQAKLDAVAEAEGDLSQIGNTQLAALRLVHQYVIPAAAAEGITIDALQANALVMNAIIQAFMQRSHHKLPRTRSEVSK